MPGKHRNLDDMPDEWFLGGLEGRPTSQSKYAKNMGIPRQTLMPWIQENRPFLYNTITRDIRDNAHEASQKTKAKEQESAEARTAEQESFVAASTDVTTLTGRKVQNLENRLRELRERNAELNKKLLKQHNLFDEIVEAAAEPRSKPNYKVRVSSSKKKPQRAMLLPIFDCQYGARVIPDDTIGSIGNFSSDVFSKRAKTYVDKVVKLAHSYAQSHHITHAVFAIGGDMVEGDEIFQGIEWQLEMPPPDQVVGMVDHLTEMIDAVMEGLAGVGVSSASIMCVPGNHGARGGRKAGARHKSDSFDVLVYKFLARNLANHPIRNFQIEYAGNCTFDVLGHLFSMIHGDEVRSWGSIPYYGMTRTDARNIRTLNVIPEYVLLGHHHTPAMIPIGYGEWLMSGNWVGATNLSGVVGSNTPQQWVFWVDPDYGVLGREPIYLDEVRRPQPTIHKTA